MRPYKIEFSNVIPMNKFSFCNLWKCLIRQGKPQTNNLLPCHAMSLVNKPHVMFCLSLSLSFPPQRNVKNPQLKFSFSQKIRIRESNEQLNHVIMFSKFSPTYKTFSWILGMRSGEKKVVLTHKNFFLS